MLLDILNDFAPGPLDFYRKKSSFDWKKLKLFIDSEDIVKYEQSIYKELQKYPQYVIDKTSVKTLDDVRYVALKQALIYKSIKLLSLETLIEDLKRPAAITRIMMQFFPDSTIKFSVTNRLFSTAILNMGSERHMHFINDEENGKIIGCYCLTEIGHGSNARGMRTTAKYDETTYSFILNSPDFEAAKCWAGGLGQCATHAIIYAKLLLKEHDYGLHAFVVPIRDPDTLIPYPGMIVGDMGEKIGLNGIDNGFVKFNNYSIPRENLLNKVGDVSEDGRYITSIKDPNKRYGAALGSLSAGRVNITCICEAMGIKALTIAIRYAAVRKQFGPDQEDEVPILEYQTHQYRLLPYLAAAYVLRIFNTYLSEIFYKFSIESIIGDKEKIQDLGIEIHAISSACKPLAGWIMKDAIQECREACGGHGYLKDANIGNIRNDHDANLTYEGENHVLIQQTSNWLLKLWPLVLKREPISTPLHSVDFLSNGLDIIAKGKFIATTIEELCELQNLLSTYQWLICYLLKISANKIELEIKSGKSSFWAKNDSQVFYAKNLATSFIQYFFLKQMVHKISECEDSELKNVLQNLCLLYGFWSLEKHIPTLFQGGFFENEEAVYLIQETILKLCRDLKDDAVSLIDVVAPPDFILDSILGASDGMVYKHLESSLIRSAKKMETPSWWNEYVSWKMESNINKL